MITERQREIITLISQGKTNKEIAIELGLSIHTVKGTVKRICDNNGVGNRAGAVSLLAK